MAFIFALASLLKYRETIESKELLVLQQLQLRALTLLRDIERLNQEHKAVTSQIDQHLAVGTSVFQMRWAREHADLLLSTRQQLEKLLDENTQQQTEQARRYQESRTNREAISEIRQRAQTEYRQEQDRREQQALDDLFAARVARENRH
jgi:flagellar export protein FliJ